MVEAPRCGRGMASTPGEAPFDATPPGGAFHHDPPPIHTPGGAVDSERRAGEIMARGS